MSRADRYAQCDDTCTVDCGACKGAGRLAAPAAEADLRKRANRIVANWRVNFDSDDDRPLVNMIDAALIEQAAEAARLRETVARVEAVADQWEAASRHLGLPDDEAEQARLAAELLRRALDGTDV